MEPIQIEIDVNKEIGQLKPIERTKCIWDFKMFEDDKYGGKPEGWFKNKYPFLDYVILMTFTGGRDYNNWYKEDQDGNPYYEFATPVRIIRNVLKQGVKPMLVIGQMPNDLSQTPDDNGDSCQWGNTCPPKDWEKYYVYIKAFARELVEKFGKSEIKTWKFRVYTEQDNKSWWTGTKEEWYKLYDYTVAAMQSEIGRDNLYIGPGNLMNYENWQDMLDHFAKGINYYTKSIGTQCDFFSISHYEGDFGPLENKLEFLQQHVRKYPELNIKEINIGEGQFLYDGMNPHHRLSMAQDASEYGAAWHAWMYVLGQEKGMEYFANWEYYCDFMQIDHPMVKTPAYNVCEAIDKMYGSTRVQVQFENDTVVDKTIGAIAAINLKTNKLFVFLYNHDSKTREVGSKVKEIEIKVNGVHPATINGLQVKHWRIDREHSNFFTKWMDFSKDFVRKETPADIGVLGSVYDTEISERFADEPAAVWNSKKEFYTSVHHLEKYENVYWQKMEEEDTLIKKIVLSEHSVSLIEICNCFKTENKQ